MFTDELYEPELLDEVDLLGVVVLVGVDGLAGAGAGAAPVAAETASIPNGPTIGLTVLIDSANKTANAQLVAFNLLFI